MTTWTNRAVNGAIGSSVTLAVTAGDLVIAFSTGWDADSGAASTVSDGVNTWTSINQFHSAGSNGRTWMCLSGCVAASTTTLTITGSGGTISCMHAAAFYPNSGTPSLSPTVSTANDVISTTVTASAGDLLVGICEQSTGNAPGSGFIQIADTEPSVRFCSEYKLSASAGSNTVNFSPQGTERGILAAAFSVSAGGSAQTLTPSLFTNSQTFYGPTITSIATLTPSLLTNSNTFYAPTVSSKNVLTPSLFSNSQSFYAPTVTSVANLTPSLFTNSNTFYTHTITGGAAVLLPPLLSNANVFYAPTVSAGPVALTPSLFTNSNTFYSATVSNGFNLAPSLFTNTHAFYSPTVTPGTVTLTPSLFSNSQNFYTHVIYIAGAPISLLPPLLTNTQSFYSPTAAIVDITWHRGGTARVNDRALPKIEGGNWL